MTDKRKGKVVDLKGKGYKPPQDTTEPVEPDEEIVKVLEDLLQKAKSGYLQEIIFTAACADGKTYSDFVGDGGEPMSIWASGSSALMLYRDLTFNPMLLLMQAPPEE